MNRRKGYYVDDPKKEGSPSSSLPPQLQQLDQSLVRAFGALENALIDLTKISQTTYNSQRALVRQMSDLLHSNDHTKEKLSALYLAVISLTENLRTLAAADNTAVGATVEAKNALIATQEKLEETVKEITGQHRLYPEDMPGDAPRGIRVLVVKITNYAWPFIVKYILWLITLLASGAYALWKVLHHE